MSRRFAGAIGRSPRDIGRPKRAACAAAIVDHNGAAELTLQQRLDGANHQIGTAASRKWHDHGDRNRNATFSHPKCACAGAWNDDRRLPAEAIDTEAAGQAALITQSEQFLRR